MNRILLFMTTAFALLSFPKASSGQAVAPALGAASSFALFTAVGAFDNVGPSVVKGDIGTNAGAFSGFPLGVVTGNTHIADTYSTQAATDVQTAFTHMSNIACVVPLALYGGPVSSPQVLTPNSYCVGAATTLAGNLILDGQGDPNALFFLRVSGALTTGEESTVTVINGASLNNVYWQVTGRVDLGRNSTFRGTLIVDGAINLVEGATLLGRGLTRAGAITMDSNTVTLACDANIAYSSSSFCQSGANPTPTVTGTSGGSFSSTTGLSIDATTGTINLAASTPGTYAVTYATTACSTTATVAITAPATAGFGYAAAAYCTSATGSAAAVLANGSTAGTFTSTTGLTLDATTGAITPSTSTPGTYTVTNTVAASGGCAATTATATATIAPIPSAAFAYATVAYCASGAPAPAPVTGTTGGTFSSTTGLVVDAATGAIDPAASTPGTYTVTYSVAGPCPASSTQDVTINAVPTAPTLTSSGTPATGILLTSGAATGNQFYLNGVAIAGATEPTYLIDSGTRNGTYTVTTTAAGCASAASAPVSAVVTAARTAANGPTLNVYPNPSPDGRLQVELAGYPKALELTVLNSLGQAVFHRSVATGSQPLVLDLSALPAGVYVLQGRSADGGSTVRRFVRE